MKSPFWHIFSSRSPTTQWCLFAPNDRLYSFPNLSCSFMLARWAVSVMSSALLTQRSYGAGFFAWQQHWSQLQTQLWGRVLSNAWFRGAKIALKRLFLYLEQWSSLSRVCCAQIRVFELAPLPSENVAPRASLPRVPISSLPPEILWWIWPSLSEIHVHQRHARIWIHRKQSSIFQVGSCSPPVEKACEWVPE